jgi:hypothetical protein
MIENMDLRHSKEGEEDKIPDACIEKRKEELKKKREESRIEGVTYMDMLDAVGALIKEGNKEQEEAMAKRLRGEIRGEVAKQSKQIGSNIANIVANEHDNLREEIKESIKKVEQIQREIYEKHTEEGITKQLNEYRESAHFVSGKYDINLTEYKTKLDELEALKKELQESITKAKNWEQRISATEIQAVDQDRKWRKNNLRISNLPPVETGETTEITVAKMILIYTLWSEDKSLENILDEIEYAHRTGRDLTNRPRQILVRFKKEEIKNMIAINSKRREIARDMYPIYIQDDLTPQDLETKANSRDYMKEAHERGLQPRFIDGNVKIRQKNGKRRIVSKEEVEKFNNSEWKILNEEGRIETREDRIRAHLELQGANSNSQRTTNSNRGPINEGTTDNDPYRNAIMIGITENNPRTEPNNASQKRREERKEELEREYKTLMETNRPNVGISQRKKELEAEYKAIMEEEQEQSSRIQHRPNQIQNPKTRVQSQESPKTPRN